MTVLASSDYPFLNIFWTMIIFFAWVAWIWIAVTVLIDLFRRRDISGWAKAAWVVFVIVLPFIGVLVYLIANHDGMADRGDKQAAGLAGADRRVRAQDRRNGRCGRRNRHGQEAARQRHDHTGRVRRDQGQGTRNGDTGLTGRRVR